MAAKSDIYVLTVVALVGIIALLLMASSIPVPEAESFTIAPSSERGIVDIRATNSLALAVPGDSDYDYNNNGKLDTQDKERLRSAVQDQKCPLLKDCDLNNDGYMDELDISIFLTLISQPPEFQGNVAAAKKNAAPSYPRNTVAYRFG